MKNVIYILIVMSCLTACNNKNQNDNGAKEPEPVKAASETKLDTVNKSSDSLARDTAHNK